MINHRIQHFIMYVKNPFQKVNFQLQHVIYK